MRIKVAVILILVFFVAALSGCVTTGAYKEKELENQGLRNQISVLETQVESKDQEISALKEELVKANEQKQETTFVNVQENASVEKYKQPSAKEVQTALKNAGFYAGNIDGQIGKKTRSAIRAFQREHKLIPNGKANKKTWVILSEYLTKKAK